MTLRADAWAVRWIYENRGLKEVRKWHNLPFIDVTANDPSVRLITKVEPQGAFDHLLFDDACYLISHMEGQYRMAARIAQETDEEGDYVYLVDAFVLDGNGVVNMYFWYNPKTDKLAIGMKNGSCCSVEKEAEFWAQGVRIVLPIIAGHMLHLAQCPEHPVEVTPAAAKRPSPKTLRKKPWIRNDLPTLILIDPTKVGLHGRKDPVGTHASPQPHQRRGHWKMLRSEKFRHKRGQRVWCRSTWVGDREWVHQGSRYRVVET